MKYALVKNGAIVEWRNYVPVGNQANLAPGKPRQLPVVTENETFNQASQVREGPEYIIEATQVIERYVVRAKNADELQAMRDAKGDEIEQEFTIRYSAPISFIVGGITHQFHADDQSIGNIMGVLMSYQVSSLVNQTLPDPRTWVPVDSLVPILITHAELAGLGLAIAARKDALFTIKKKKEVAVAALTVPAEIQAYDATIGWK